MARTRKRKGAKIYRQVDEEKALLYDSKDIVPPAHTPDDLPYCTAEHLEYAPKI